MRLFMRHTLFAMLVVALAVSLVSASANAAARFAAGELVIKMAPGYSVEVVTSQYGTAVNQHLSQLDIYLLDIIEASDLEPLAEEISNLAEVEFCHPNFLIDPLQSVQGSLPVSDAQRGGDYGGQEAVTQLGLTNAHQLATGAGVAVAILDGGVNYVHPELASFVTPGYDYVDFDADPFDELGGPNEGHGTFVAGVTHLAAPNAEIRAYRVTDPDGLSDGYVVAEAILQAVTDGCRVINLSLVTMDVHNAIAAAVAYAAEQDVLVVAAAGNGNNDDAHYPASDPYVLAVAAVDPQNQLADFSSFGGNIDICAPGTNIYAPFLGDGYAWWGGTSFAAPFVAAQIALLWEQTPDATRDEILTAILTTATNIDNVNPGMEGNLGVGLINPLGSVIAMRGETDKIYVPAEYATIQEALDASITGDTVFVGPGTYVEQLTVLSKGIVIISTHGPETTFIEAPPEVDSTIVVALGYYPTEFSGFTIRNGNYGVVALQGANLVIRNCHITDHYGYPIRTYMVTIQIVKSFFSRNEYPVSLAASSVVFDSNLVVDNVANENYEWETLSFHYCTGLARNNIIARNWARYAIETNNGSVAWYNNTIVGNSSHGIKIGNNKASNNLVAFNGGIGIWQVGATVQRLQYNNSFGNLGGDRDGYITTAVGEMSLDPMFVNANGLDFRLEPGSPCIDTGDPDPLLNDPDGSRSDFGAINASIAHPVAAAVSFGPVDEFGVINNLSPAINWTYHDDDATTQVQYQVEVGIANGTSVVKIWDTGPLTGSNQSIAYAGTPLSDRTRYYVKIRLHDGADWGDWRTISMPIRISRASIVPDDHATIQMAIDASFTGDTIYVGPGTYVEEIRTVSNGLVIRSADGLGTTYIEPPDGADNTVTVLGGSFPVTFYELCFRNGRTGIAVNFAALVEIRNCRFEVFAHQAIKTISADDVVVVGSEFIGNRQAFDGLQSTIRFDSNLVTNGYCEGGCQAAVLFMESDGVAGYNTFTNNETNAMQLYHCSMLIRNNTFYGNILAGIHASNKGGTYAIIPQATIINNLVVGNGSGIQLGTESWEDCIVQYNNCYDNVGEDRLGFVTPNPGGISVDPMFVDAAAGDFSLTPNSPCIDAGDPDHAYDDTDGSRSDIGAIHSVPAYPIGLDILTGPQDAYGAVRIPTPTISWSYYSLNPETQQQYQIQVGTDDDWNVAEVWDSGPITSSEPTAVYGGLTLEDRTQYEIRIRLHDGGQWGAWRSVSMLTHFGRKIYVPGDYQTVHEAAYVSQPGDTILVGPGVYVGQVQFKSEGITLLSTSGREHTFLEAPNSSKTAIAVSSGDLPTVVSGFTIRNSLDGVDVPEDAGCIIRDCSFLDNTNFGVGSFRSSYVEIVNSVFRRNGRAISLGASLCRVDSNLIVESTGLPYGDSTAVYFNGCTGHVRYNVIARNETFSGMAVRYGDLNITNNTIYGNANVGIQIARGNLVNNLIVFNKGVGLLYLASDPPPHPDVRYNNVFGNLGGDIEGDLDAEPGGLSVDPMFVDSSGINFRLFVGSPCIDAGDPNPDYNDPDGSRSDIGAVSGAWESCCVGMRGDVNGDGNECTISDISVLIDHLFLSGVGLDCREEANMNADILSDISIGDISAGIDYLFISGQDLPQCDVFSAKVSAPAHRSKITVWNDFKNDTTSLYITTAEVLRGVHINLIGADQGLPRLAGELELDLINGRTEDTLRLGLIDLDGPGTISQGEHLLVRIPGRYVVSHAVASDMGHQTVPLEIKSGRPNLPTSFELKPNYPNPFNPITVIEFGLPQATPVKLIVYNILGQVVTKLVDRELPAGWHSVDWDAGSVASGVYFYRLAAGSFTQSRKMILIK